MTYLLHFYLSYYYLGKLVAELHYESNKIIIPFSIHVLIHRPWNTFVSWIWIMVFLDQSWKKVLTSGSCQIGSRNRWKSCCVNSCSRWSLSIQWIHHVGCNLTKVQAVPVSIQGAFVSWPNLDCMNRLEKMSSVAVEWNHCSKRPNIRWITISTSLETIQSLWRHVDGCSNAGPGIELAIVLLV